VTLPTHQQDRRPWHGGRILVAEDNYMLADVICDFLRDCGLTPVGPAARLPEASRLARQRALDGAVLDLKLGERLCLPVCSILSARRIPFLFLTGYGDLSLIPLEFRSVPLICKPFETDEMKSALAAMLDRSLSALAPGASPAARPN
jgi:DNA-binding response OmpR family regulator